MTLGTDRVRAPSAPSGNVTADNIKLGTANLIDLCEELRASRNDEVQRLVSLAQTAYEEAAMWAVKAATS